MIRWPSLIGGVPPVGPLEKLKGGLEGRLEAPSRDDLAALADRLRESLLAEGARRGRERLIEEIATMIEAEAEAQPRPVTWMAFRDLARRVREMLHG